MKQDTLSIKDWADKKASEYINTIKAYVADGWTLKDAFNAVMKASTLGSGYRAQIRHELGMGMFD